MNYSVCVVTLEGDEISVVQVEVSELLLELGKGVERAGKVVSTLDVCLVPSRRPRSTLQRGPPACAQFRSRFFSVSSGQPRS